MVKNIKYDLLFVELRSFVLLSKIFSITGNYEIQCGIKYDSSSKVLDEFLENGEQLNTWVINNKLILI